MMIEGKGDLLPVSALPVDGTFPREPPATRSGASRCPSRSGIPTSASSAGSAPWSAPTRPSAPRPSPSRPWRASPSRYQSRAYSGKEYPGFQLIDPGRTRRLHRLRRLRGRLPGPEQGDGQAQGHQHGAEARPPRRRAGELRLLPRDPRDRPQAGQVRGDQGLAASPAPLRVSRERAPAAARRPT